MLGSQARPRREPRLAKACRHLLNSPTQAVSIDEMARVANMSRRTFTRQFREVTGASFVGWKQQVCVLEALSRLSQGASVKVVSSDLGYSSTSAFAATFRLLLGDAPVRYLARYREITRWSASSIDARQMGAANQDNRVNQDVCAAA